MSTIGYIPFEFESSSNEAWLVAKALGCDVFVLTLPTHLTFNCHTKLPALEELAFAIRPILHVPWVIVEGPGGFLWVSILRFSGFKGGVTILPYINPISWYEISYALTYSKFAKLKDRIFLGSNASAALYCSLGLEVYVGEPFGIDCNIFKYDPNLTGIMARYGIPKGKTLLYAGRFDADKNIKSLLRCVSETRRSIPDLILVIATHSIDAEYLSTLRKDISPEKGVFLIQTPSLEQLSVLYNDADAFITAATSYYETFGRAPAESLACGTMAIAPRYDGFRETLAQPGGVLVDVDKTENTVAVNEKSLCRAIYDIFDAKAPLSPKEISAASRSRFCRCKTMRVLDYLAKPESSLPVKAKPISVQLDLPTCWQSMMHKMEMFSPKSSLEFLYHRNIHRNLQADDRDFQRAVMKFLATD